MRRVILSAILIVTLIGAIYSPVRDFDFVKFDDPQYVQANDIVHQGLTGESIHWAFTATDPVYWHPLTWLSHMLDVQLFGLDAGRHHLTNVALHAINTVLLLLVLWRMTGAVWRSVLVAAIFAFHPLDVESVAWVSGRKNLLSTMFWLGAMLAYVSYVRQKSLPRYALIVLMMALGLMAKPMLVTLPCAFLLLDYWPLGRFRREPVVQLIKEKIPLFGLSIALGIVTIISQQQHAINSSLEFTFPIRAANTIVAYARYVGKMFWPSDLVMFYTFPHAYAPGYWAPWIVITSLLFLVAATYGAIKLAKNVRYRYVIVGWLWFLGTMLPMMGLLTQQGSQSLADRFTYVPLIGLYVVLVWAVTDLVRRTRSSYVIAAGAGAVAIIALIICTSRQLPHWRNSRALFTHAVQVDPDNWLANHSMSIYYYRQGDKTRAFEYMEKMLRIPAFGRHARQRVYDVLGMMANDREGFETLRSAAINRLQDPRARLHFGIALSLNRQPQAALKHVRRDIDMAPDYAHAWSALAQVLIALEQPEEAEKALRYCLVLDPVNPDAHLTLATILRRQGHIEESRMHLKAVTEYDPMLLKRLKPGAVPFQ
jgi:tetratricopeptide (TPR) repeat protein